MTLALALTVAACSGGTTATIEDSTTSTASTSSTSETTTTTLPPETTTTRPLVGVSTDFARTVIELDGVVHAVAVANTNEQRVQGLMGVEALDPLFGMLFVFEDAAVRFPVQPFRHDILKRPAVLPAEPERPVVDFDLDTM